LQQQKLPSTVGECGRGIQSLPLLVEDVVYRYSSCDTIEFWTDEQRTRATAAAVPSSSFVEDEEISWRSRGRARMAIRTLPVV
jgi:hypothetical protein